MKYIIYKDYMTGEHILGYSYTTIDAKDMFDLFEQADRMWGEEQDKLYLMQIMKKVPNMTHREENGWKADYYEAVMCKRSNVVGWHRNDEQHSEAKHVIKRVYKKDLEYFV